MRCVRPLAAVGCLLLVACTASTTADDTTQQIVVVEETLSKNEGASGRHLLTTRVPAEAESSLVQADENEGLDEKEGGASEGGFGWKKLQKRFQKKNHRRHRRGWTRHMHRSIKKQQQKPEDKDGKCKMTLFGNPRFHKTAKGKPMCSKPDEKLWVRCCNKNGKGKVSMRKYGCKKGKTFKEAERICKGKGFRLCTVDEIKKGLTSGTGCGFDWQRVWTSSDGNEEDNKEDNKEGEKEYDKDVDKPEDKPEDTPENEPEDKDDKNPVTGFTTTTTTTTTATTTAAPAGVVEQVIYKEDDQLNRRSEVVSGQIKAEPNTSYIVSYDVLRSNLGQSQAYVVNVKVNGVNLSGCNPPGSDYECDFVRCSSSSKDFRSATGIFDIEMVYTGHSKKCHCDKASWKCVDERRRAAKDKTPIKAAMKFTLTPGRKISKAPSS